MAVRKLKPIEERDPYAAAVLDAFDKLEPKRAIECLEWHDASTDKPDSDMTVLCWGGEGFFCGYWDDSIPGWIGCESGGSVLGVTHWSNPEGPEATPNDQAHRGGAVCGGTSGAAICWALRRPRKEKSMNTVMAKYRATTETGSSLEMGAELPLELNQMIVWSMHHQDDAMRLLPAYRELR